MTDNRNGDNKTNNNNNGAVVTANGNTVEIIPDGEDHRHKARALTETVQALFVEEA